MDVGGHRHRRRMNVKVDRLSSLPDDLIHRILSLVGTKLAIRTSVLSSKWRSMWTSLPCIDFSSEDFRLIPKFVEVVNNVLSRRDDQVEVSSVKLRFCAEAGHVVIQTIMNYALSHNVQQMDVTCLVTSKIEIPLYLSRSQTLQQLSLNGTPNFFRVTLTSNWELPYLTTLHLSYVILYNDNTDKCVDFFSKCANLKNLTLIRCKMMGRDVLTICHPQLSNLTLEHKNWSTGGWRSVVVNVDAPQLKNLTITSSFGKYLINAPQLVNLLFKGYSPFLFSANGFHSLEKAHVCIYHLNSDAPKVAPDVISLLQQLRHVKFLTLNVELLEILDSSEVISHQTSPLANLKSLWILPIDTSFWTAHPVVTIPTKVKSYLINSSPNATLTEVPLKECIGVVRYDSTELFPSC